MFASSQHPLPLRLRAELSRPVFADGEGRDCEACRRVTETLLLPESRPGAWLLLLAGACVYVVIQSLALQLA
jgi:hypothetical protein